MTLIDIIPLLIAGDHVRRFEWRHNEHYLFRHVSESGKWVTINYRDGAVSTYTINNADAWADDWEPYP